MDNEILDRLLIDRAVGALDPDVETLLDDYLARNREIEERFLETAEVVKLSRTLLRSEGNATLPAFQVPHEFRSSRRRILPLQIVGAAAALLVSFFLGRQYPDNELPQSRQSIAVSVPVETHPPSEGMWTITRTRLSPKRPIRTTYWKWTSPVRQPEAVNQGEVL